jgi:DNA-binding transcriptional regulator YdaS (Cro superfamily)
MAANSADNNQNPEAQMTRQPEENRQQAAPERAPSATRAERTRCWIEALRRSDVTRLWTELHRVVCSHPLVRASHSAGLLVEGAERGNAYVDLTQELFVTLLAKGRFQHYLDSEMTDAEIECEIGQIELTNLLTAELRKRHPESYRLARRISTIIQSSANFRRFDSNGDPADEEQHRRLADRVYGLSEWPDAKPRRGAQELEQRAQMIPVRQRDTRMVGCTGDAQIIISNSDLEDLIVSVLEAVDAPVDVRSLRSLVMSRLPVMDIYLVPLGGDDSDDGRVFEPVDGRENPEEGLLRRESEQEAAGYVDRFLRGLHTSVRGKSKQYDRILGVLWHCYLSPDHVTQLEAAARLGVSDSLVSDYRRRIEQQLRALAFSEIEQARRFELSLRERVYSLVVVGAEEGVAV